MVKLEKNALAVWPGGADVEGNMKVLQGEYAVGGLTFKEPPVVLDIGAHIGAFARWAKDEWPGAIIFCYEPHPSLYKALVENVGSFATTRKCAVSDADGTAPLFEGFTNLGASSLKHTVETKNAGGNVKVVHASRLPECDVLKIDTEGSELDILRNYPHLSRCKAVVLEWHSQRDREEIRELLGSLGFLITEDTSWHPERGNLKFVRPDRPCLFVAILAGGGKLFYENELCVSMLRELAPKAGLDVLVSYDPGTGVDRARNRQVAAFLKSKATHLMMLDNDLGFNPNDVVKMVASNLDFVAGAYPRKQVEWAQVEAAVRQGVPAEKLHEWACSFIYNTVVDNDGGNNAIEAPGLGTFIEIEEIGTGFMVMKRSVIEKMIAAYKNEMAYVTDYEPRGEIHHMVFACGSDPRCKYEQAKEALLRQAIEFGKLPDCTPADVQKLFDVAVGYSRACEDPAGFGRYLTEDYRMCRLWRMLGGKIYLFIECDLDHIGGMTFQGRVRHLLRKVDTADSKSDPTKDQRGSSNP